MGRVYPALVKAYKLYAGLTRGEEEKNEE